MIATIKAINVRFMEPPYPGACSISPCRIRERVKRRVPACFVTNLSKAGDECRAMRFPFDHCAFLPITGRLQRFPKFPLFFR
jgi:hypothetical protein